jgi:hypothetical protein
MATQKIDCPHCRQDRLMESAGYSYLTSDSAYFWFICPSCKKPIAVLAEADNPSSSDYKQSSYVNQDSLSFRKCGWKVIDTWPKPAFSRGECPAGVPENIGAMFEQCQEVASRRGYDLAIMGFYRVLEMARKAHSPESHAKPHAWILSLVRSGDLTKDMGEWANRLRGLRRDLIDADAKQTEEFSVFCNIVLDQLFGTRSWSASFRN